MTDIAYRRRLLDESGLRDLPDPEWIVHGVLPKAGFCLLYSAPGVGKSIQAASLVGAIVSGFKFLGNDVVEPGPVVIVPAEDLHGARTRHFKWRDAVDIPSEVELAIYTWPHDLNLFSGEGFLGLCEEVVRVGAKLVVFDTWAWVTAGADENTARDTGISLSRLSTLRRTTGCSVLILHHATKDGGGERGSGALRAAMDTVICLVGDKDDDEVISVVCEKQRNGPKFPPIKLRLDTDALVFRPLTVSLTKRLPDKQREVLDALRDLGGSGASASDWKRAAKERGITERYFWDAKKILMSRGMVGEPAAGVFHVV